eukprot:SAG25_NODE_373_length_8948_cov_6.275059_8_plen_150_part_00
MVPQAFPLHDLHELKLLTRSWGSGAIGSRVIGYRAIDYRAIDYRAIDYRVIGYHVIGSRVIDYHVIDYHVIGYHVIGYRVIGYRAAAASGLGLTFRFKNQRELEAMQQPPAGDSQSHEGGTRRPGGEGEPQGWWPSQLWVHFWEEHLQV